MINLLCMNWIPSAGAKHGQMRVGGKKGIQP